MSKSEQKNESQQQVMRNKVASEISILHAHPILYKDYSSFELVKNLQLSKFSIKMLIDIELRLDSIFEGPR